jgi:hypothetical protein
MALPGLPQPNQLLAISTPYSSPMLKGVRFNSADPLKLEFIIDTADQGKVDKDEAAKLVKYFLAGLTLPENDLWVNLSPYEANRIVPEVLSQTDLGKDLLGEDYILKQLASSLTYPEQEPGKSYWQSINNPVGAALRGRPGQAQGLAPTNTFNRVWIMPDKATIYENKNTAFITESSMKVMTEEDYTAIQKNSVGANNHSPAMQSFKTHILPAITQEVNQGQNFACLRQIYNSLMLAVWFKEKFKQSFYKSYIDQKKISGIDLSDKTAKEKIYNLYVEAFKNGVYNYVKPQRPPYGGNLATVSNGVLRTGSRLSRIKYFSGGVLPVAHAQVTPNLPASGLTSGQPTILDVDLTDDARSDSDPKFPTQGSELSDAGDVEQPLAVDAALATLGIVGRLLQSTQGKVALATAAALTLSGCSEEEIIAAYMLAPFIIIGLLMAVINISEDNQRFGNRWVDYDAIAKEEAERKNQARLSERQEKERKRREQAQKQDEQRRRNLRERTRKMEREFWVRMQKQDDQMKQRLQKEAQKAIRRAVAANPMSDDAHLEQAYANPNNIAAIAQATIGRRTIDWAIYELKKLGGAGVEIASRLEQLRDDDSGVSPDGKQVVKSKINRVRGATHSHAGGIGINIRYVEGMTAQQATSETIHEALAGNIFGKKSKDSAKIHDLAKAVEEALTSGEETKIAAASYRLNHLGNEGLFLGAKSLWKMTQAERDSLVRDYASERRIKVNRAAEKRRQKEAAEREEGIRRWGAELYGLRCKMGTPDWDNVFNVISALKPITDKLIKEGSTDDAAITLRFAYGQTQHILGYAEKARALCDIGVMQAKAGFSLDAKKSFKAANEQAMGLPIESSLDPVYPYDHALAGIVLAQVGVRFYDDARDTAGKIRLKHTREVALLSIADSERGDSALAKASASRPGDLGGIDFNKQSFKIKTNSQVENPAVYAGVNSAAGSLRILDITMQAISSLQLRRMLVGNRLDILGK